MIRMGVILFTLFLVGVTINAIIYAPSDISRWLTITFIGIPLLVYLILSIINLILMIKLDLVFFRIRKLSKQRRDEFNQIPNVDFEENL